MLCLLVIPRTGALLVLMTLLLALISQNVWIWQSLQHVLTCLSARVCILRDDRRTRLAHRAMAAAKAAVVYVPHKPERILVCDKYGNARYVLRKDSTLMVRGSTASEGLALYQDVSHIKVRSKGLWDDVAIREAAAADTRMKQQDSVARKLPNVDDSGRNESPMVRNGVSPAHKVLITDPDTGEKHLIKIPEKPHYVPIGLHSSVPKQR